MSESATLDSRYSWGRLALTLLVASIGNTSIWAVVVVMPGIEAEFGIGRSSSALAYTLTMAGFALGNVVFGKAVDRYGITLTIAFAALVMSAGYLLAAIAPNPVILLLAMFVVGFGSAATFAPLIADISQWFLRRRGIAVAIAASGNYFAGALWPMLLAGLLAGSGWRAVYGLLAVVMLVCLLPLALALRRRIPAAAQATSDAAMTAAGRTIGFHRFILQWLLVLAGFGCCMAMAMPQVHIVSMSVDLGYGAAAGAQILAVMLFGGIVSRLTFGVIADRLGGVPTLLISSGLQCLALFLYLPFDSFTALLLVSLVFGLAQGGIVPCYAIIVREYFPAREAGARIGLVIMATIVGMAVGGFASGFIYDLTGSYDIAFLHGIFWNCINLAVMGFVLLSSRTRPLAPA
ncbi:MAG: MFS transporter [Pseudomonadota bacterium]